MTLCVCVCVCVCVRDSILLSKYVICFTGYASQINVHLFSKDTILPNSLSCDSFCPGCPGTRRKFCLLERAMSISASVFVINFGSESPFMMGKTRSYWKFITLDLLFSIIRYTFWKTWSCMWFVHRFWKTSHILNIHFNQFNISVVNQTNKNKILQKIVDAKWYWVNAAQRYTY